MYIKEDSSLQTIAGKSFIFLKSEDKVDMTRILSFNKSSVWLWNELKGKEFTEEEAFELLFNRYDATPQTIRENLKWWIDSLVKMGIIIQ